MSPSNPSLNKKKESVSDIKLRLTDFGKEILKDRYLMPGEDYKDLFERVAKTYSDNKDHEERILYYLGQLWFMPATPILSNGGTARGLPISCFLNHCADSLKGIVHLWNENVWLASRGGGIGSYWGDVRSIGEAVGHEDRSGKSSGIIPFINVMNSMTLAISQGMLRRGSAAVYLPIDHPEIEEFIDIRKPHGGDPARKALNLHHGVCITDKFMRAVAKNNNWDLISPYTKKVINTVKARNLWIKLLLARVETGEPYILFIDNVNKAIPKHHKQLGLKVYTSNLCSEITLPTGFDHLGKNRTAVCCLSSINLEYYDKWKTNKDFIPDIMRFLDNVLTDFINTAPPEMSNATYSATRERSVGLGAMGFHSYLQSRKVSFESVTAKALNKEIFAHIKKQADETSILLAKERGACPDAADKGVMERFSCKLAVAPNASISVICGESSPGIEPYNANVYVQKTLTGSFIVKNKHLKILLAEKGYDNDEIWTDIAAHQGSVQHLDILSDYEKSIFKTAHEINQMWMLEHVADRTPFICQSQSTNLFLPGNINKKILHKLHYYAWKKGIKSLYYLRSTAVSRGKLSKDSYEQVQSVDAAISQDDNTEPTSNDFEECIACQ